MSMAKITVIPANLTEAKSVPIIQIRCQWLGALVTKGVADLGSAREPDAMHKTIRKKLISGQYTWPRTPPRCGVR